jgi:hypothetical protein
VDLENRFIFINRIPGRGKGNNFLYNPVPAVYEVVSLKCSSSPQQKLGFYKNRSSPGKAQPIQTGIG